MVSPKKKDDYKQILQARLAESERILAAAEQDTRASSARHSDSADQASAEYERQTLAHKAASAQRLVQNLKQALARLDRGNFGECEDCGGEIDPKRLEALPWARLCLACQHAREVT